MGERELKTRLAGMLIGAGSEYAKKTDAWSVPGSGHASMISNPIRQAGQAALKASTSVICVLGSANIPLGLVYR